MLTLLVPRLHIDADSLQHLSAEPNIILVLHLIAADQFFDTVVEGVVISSEPLSPEPKLFMQHPQNGRIDFGDVFSVVLGQFPLR